MYVGTISQPKPDKEGVNSGPYCVEPLGVQWSCSQAQFPTPTSFVQTFKCIFSVVSGHKTRVCHHPASVGATPAQPARSEPDKSRQADQKSYPTNRTGPAISPWGKKYLMLSIVALMGNLGNTSALQDRHAAQVEVWDCQHPISNAAYDGRTHKPDSG